MPAKKRKIAVRLAPRTKKSKRTGKRMRVKYVNPGALVSASPSANPPLLTDLAEFIVPGFAGYAATRLLARVTYVQLSKKWPKASRHLAAGSGVGAFLASWYLLHHVERLKKYHTPATVGAAIAALQTIVQTYLPKFGWIVSDFQPTVGSVTSPMVAPKPTAAQIAAATAEIEAQDDEDDALVDPLNPLDPALGTLGGSTIGGMADDDLEEFMMGDMN
jgi:hypothetical protein